MLALASVACLILVRLSSVAAAYVHDPTLVAVRASWRFHEINLADIPGQIKPVS